MERPRRANLPAVKYSDKRRYTPRKKADTVDLTAANPQVQPAKRIPRKKKEQATEAVVIDLSNIQHNAVAITAQEEGTKVVVQLPEAPEAPEAAEKVNGMRRKRRLVQQKPAPSAATTSTPNSKMIAQPTSTPNSKQTLHIPIEPIDAPSPLDPPPPSPLQKDTSEDVVEVQDDDESVEVDTVPRQRRRKFEAGSPEWLEHVREQNRRYRHNKIENDRATALKEARANWAAKKEEYNAARKAKRAKAREMLMVRDVGRPKAPPLPDPIQLPEVPIGQVEQAWNIPEHLPNSVIEVPQDLQEALQAKEIHIPKDKAGLRITAGKRLKWNDLQPSSVDGYVRELAAVMKRAGYNLPEDMLINTKEHPFDPIEVADWALTLPIDMWKVIHDNYEGRSDRQRNKSGAALLAIFNARAYLQFHTSPPPPIGERQMYLLLQYLLLSAKFNQIYMGKSGGQHAKQVQSDLAAANTVPWKEWETMSSKFITRKWKMAAFEDKRDAMMMAVYTWQPPIRCNWNSVRFTDKAPTLPEGVEQDRAAGNWIVVGDKVTTHWNDFKNVNSFRGSLPVKVEVEDQRLIKLIKEWKAINVSPCMFPKSNTAASTFLQKSYFCQKIGDLTEAISRRRFTTQRLRASYISWWHTAHATGRALNIEQVAKVMRSMHQTNLQVHLGYAKVGKHNPADEARIREQFDKEMKRMLKDAHKDTE